MDGLANQPGNVAVAARIQNAAALARSREKESLVADYYRYRRALQDVETFSERQTSYQEELARIRERRVAPEGFLDEQAVQRRVEELLEKYSQRSKTGGDSTGSENGNHPMVGPRDEKDGVKAPEAVVDSSVR